jgi:cobalt/nickel transport system ATP-binding protein
MTGIEHLLNRTPHHLSGGEKQMVAIAGLLAMMPRIILYDEPTANLDLRTRRRLIRFLQNSSETMLISTHDLEFVLEVCDRVC